MMLPILSHFCNRSTSPQIPTWVSLRQDHSLSGARRCTLSHSLSPCPGGVEETSPKLSGPIHALSLPSRAARAAETFSAQAKNLGHQPAQEVYLRATKTWPRPGCIRRPLLWARSRAVLSALQANPRVKMQLFPLGKCLSSPPGFYGETDVLRGWLFTGDPIPSPSGA